MWPAYFAEFRAALVADVVREVLLAQPHMATTAFRYLKHGAQALQQEADGDD